jgi:hypothetical protein
MQSVEGATMTTFHQVVGAVAHLRSSPNNEHGYVR